MGPAPHPPFGHPFDSLASLGRSGQALLPAVPPQPPGGEKGNNQVMREWFKRSASCSRDARVVQEKRELFKRSASCSREARVVQVMRELLPLSPPGAGRAGGERVAEGRVRGSSIVRRSCHTRISKESFGDPRAEPTRTNSAVIPSWQSPEGAENSEGFPAWRDEPRHRLGGFLAALRCSATPTARNDRPSRKIILIPRPVSSPPLISFRG